MEANVIKQAIKQPANLQTAVTTVAFADVSATENSQGIGDVSVRVQIILDSNDSLGARYVQEMIDRVISGNMNRSVQVRQGGQQGIMDLSFTFGK